MRQEVYRNTQFLDLKKFVSRYNPQKVFLVVDKNSYEVSGARLFIEKSFDVSMHVAFSDFNPNPQLSDLKKGISLFKDGKYELILAIGGGSVIDMAKLISVMAHQDQDVKKIAKGSAILNNKKTPLLTIPTTAGTGAEATSFAVLYIDKVKYSVANESISPNYIFLSPEFLMSAPPYLTACTGLDAFCQAIESVWSINSTTESEKYAFEAIDIVWNNLKMAVVDNDKKAKSLMQEAAYLAGKAINNTKTTAPHALSYAFTSYYNIPHGHAVALSLPFFFEYNYGVSDIDCNDTQGGDIVRNRIDEILKIMNLNIENVNNKLTLFFDSIGININISTLIKDFNSDIIINNINLERLNNNPRKINKTSLMSFLNNCKY